MDALPFVVGFLILALSVVAGVAAWRYRRQRIALDAETIKRLEAERRREKTKLDEAITLGTHLANGLPRCQASPLCQSPATRSQPVIARDEAWTDFARRAFGGAARYRLVVTPPDEKHGAVYCDAHGYLAEQEVRAELSEIELARQDALRETEARLARFERVGLPSRLLARIAKEEEPKKKAPRSNVVSLTSRTGSG